MPLATVVDLDPGHIVLNGVPALRERGTEATPLFGPCLLWPRPPNAPISASADVVYKPSAKNHWRESTDSRKQKFTSLNDGIGLQP